MTRETHKWLGRLAVAGLAVLTLGAFAPQGVQAKTAIASKDDTTKTAGPRVFVSPKWVQQTINGKTSTKDYKVFEASYGNDKTFKKGHIPGAVHINTNDIEATKTWNLKSAEQIKKVLLKHGVTSKTTLIVYSQDVNAASRVAFAAFYTGVNNVKVLDGNYQGWQKSNYKIQKGAAKSVKAATNFGIAVPANAKYEVKTSADVLKQQKADKNVILASTRSWKEFTGKTSGYSYIKDKGEPKGAVYAKSSKTSNDVAYLLHKDGTVKSIAEVAPMWAKSGIKSTSNVDFYCGTGWRAATAFFIAYQGGWQNVHLFDGGWYDWDIAHQKNPKQYPVQVGAPGSKSFKIVTSKF